MALIEFALVSLAFNLAVNPQPTDFQTYHQLSKPQQIQVQRIIEEKDLMPLEIHELIRRGEIESIAAPARMPCYETGSE